MRRPSQWLLAGAVLIMVVGAMLNLAVVWRFPVSSPFVRYESGSLTDLARENQRTVDRRFSFYLELYDRTEGGALVVPDPSPVDRELVEGLAGLRVEGRSYDPSRVPDSVRSRYSPLGEVEVEEGSVAYSILPGEADEARWIGRVGDGLVVIPESVAPVPGRET